MSNSTVSVRIAPPPVWERARKCKKGLLLSLRVKKIEIGEYLAKLQARAWLSHALCAPGQLTAKLVEHAQDNHVLGCNCNFTKYAPISTFFTPRLINKSFLIWLLIRPPYLKYVATLPCNVSLMTCFGDINVSQGSVATYARCGGTFNTHVTANLPRNLPVKKFFKSVKI